MKSPILFSLALASSALLAHSAQLEVRVLQVSGTVPAAPELDRLEKAGVLPSSASFVTRIRRDGSYAYSTMKPVTYASSFAPTGAVQETETKDIGLACTGRVEKFGGSYTVEVKYSNLELAQIHLYPGKKGVVFPQPIFRTRRLTTEVNGLTPGVWVALPFPAFKNEGPQTVLLLRVR